MEKGIGDHVGTKTLMDTLEISRSTINRMAKRGMPHVWVGSVRRYPLQQVLDWLRVTYGGNR